MELFDIVVRREILRQKYLEYSEGQIPEYTEAVRQLKEEVGDEDLYAKACLFDAVRQNVYLNIKYKDKTVRQDITNLLFNAFNEPMDYPSTLEKLMDDTRYKFETNINEYNEIIDDVLEGEYGDDEWFFNNQDLSEDELNSTYFRRRIIKLIEARLDYEKSSIMINVELPRDSKDKPLRELEDLIQEFEDYGSLLVKERKRSKDKKLTKDERDKAIKNLDTLERISFTYDADSDEVEKPLPLIDRLNEAGIKKQVFYNYRNGKDVEFSRKFYFSVATFLAFADYKTERFFNIHGLSYQVNLGYNNDIYKTAFDYGLDEKAVTYMLEKREDDRIKHKKKLEKQAKEKKENKPEKERVIDEVTDFKRKFNAKKDYFDLMIKLTTGSITQEELYILDYSLTLLDRLLADYIRDRQPKVETRVNSIKRYELSKNEKFKKDRIRGSEKFTTFDLDKIINASVKDTRWDVTYIVPNDNTKDFLVNRYPDAKDIHELRVEINNAIYDLPEINDNPLLKPTK